jgi:hypothetical protein
MSDEPTNGNFQKASLLVWMFLGSLLPGGLAQVPLSEALAGTQHSHSGQFVIQAPPPEAAFVSELAFATNRDFVHLEPALLTVSCERIKELVSHELQAAGPWQGKIYVRLYPARAAQAPITVASTRFSDGWQYGIELPDVIERARYVQAIVQVVLLEMANRNAGTRGAEVPLWLSEGLARQLLASSETEIILAPPTPGVHHIGFPATFANARTDDPLQSARKLFKTRQPLTFDQLSWPVPDQLSGDAGEVYSRTAQLFVNDLLSLPAGRACARAMLADLPQFYNWQFAFLHAFQPDFQRLSDVETWWAMHVLQFTGHNILPPWTPAESSQKLAQILRPPVEIRTATNDLPLRTYLTLQTIIREWDRVPQTTALSAKLRQLESLRWSLSPEFARLADDYHRTISAYLQNRDRTSSAFTLRKRAALRRVADEAIRQLEALDERRETQDSTYSHRTR